MARDSKYVDQKPSGAAPSETADTPTGGKASGESERFLFDPRTGPLSGKSSRWPQPKALSAALTPGLYLTATPIGNAADITLRALSILNHCDAIVAEDTRVTARLLAIHGISRPLFAYNDHNAPAMRPKLIGKLKEGARLALVSDAGTPLVSDPGHKLVRAAREARIAVFPVPGPSAALAALTASGLPSDRFLFAGFLPSKPGARRSTLTELRGVPATLIFFESPQRLGESLADMSGILGIREAAVAREITKLHEEFSVASLASLAETYAAEMPKGEVTIVVGPPPEEDIDRARIDSLLKEALAFMPVSAASRLVADALAAPRRAVYERALALKGKDSGGAAD